MIRSLRKGHSSVYLQHSYTSHTIGAEKLECEVTGDRAVLRFTLRPVSLRQRDDEEYLHSDTLLAVDVDDGRVIDGLLTYLEHHADEVTAYELLSLPRFHEHQVTQP